MSSVRQHQLVAFFALAFVASWAIWAPAVVLSRGSFDPRASAYFHLAGSLGPMFSALVVTSAVGGAAGVSELLGRMARWRVGVRWWLVALFGPALLFFVSAVIVRAFFGEWPDLGVFGRSEEFAWLGLVGYWFVAWCLRSCPRVQTSTTIWPRNTSEHRRYF